MQNHLISRSLFIMLVSLLALSTFAQSDSEIQRFTAHREDRIKWWEQARFGMFIHWGLYSKLAGEYEGNKIKGLGEWIMYDAKIPLASYSRVASTFNPVAFNADRWVRLARDAGMKYIVITAKHCDGFAMFASGVNNYNIVNGTPFHRDPMKELEAACRKYGLRLGFYYSQDWDWSEKDAEGRPNTWDFPENDQKNPDIYYRTKAIPQIKELVTQYDPAIIWFDVPSDITRAQSFQFLKTIREARPDCIINDRIGKEHSGGTTGHLLMGDYHTPEQYIPEETTHPFEVCMTINDTWGYKYYDRDWKSAKTIIANLTDIAAKGGNYLLNIGPDGEGRVPGETVKVLEIVGQWMKKNGESIYGTSRSPLGKLPFKESRCTARPGKLFIHLLDWPEGDRVIIPGLLNKIEEITFLANPSVKIPFSTTPSNDIEIDLNPGTLPKLAVDPLSTVLVIKYAGTLHVQRADDIADPAFPTVFDPIDARPSSDSMKYGFNKTWNTERGFETLRWTDTTSISWNFRTIRKGQYEVEISYGADENSSGNQMVLSIGNNIFPFTTGNTGGWHTPGAFILGKVELPANLHEVISLHPRVIQGNRVMNIRSVKLLPIIK